MRNKPLTDGWMLRASVMVLIALFVYMPALRGGFVWDDDDHLTANPAMTAPHGWQMIWSSLVTSRYYPLTLTTFWIERRLWGLNPMPYHFVNIVLHAVNGFLIFLLLDRLRAMAAWPVAIFWMVHPVNVESVAWVTELKNTQSGVFFFCSVFCFLRFETRGERWWYGLSLVCGTAALLSKPSTVVLPAALLLCAWWKRGRLQRADVVRVSPFAALALAMSLLTIVEQRRHVQLEATSDWSLGLAERFVVAGRALWFYADKLFWPFDLAFVYPRWTIDSASLSAWVPLAGVVTIGTILFVLRKKPWARAGLFGLGFFVAALLPVLGFIDVYYFRYSFVADHFQYLASLGPVALAAAGVTAIVRTKRMQSTLAIAAGVMLSALSWRQSKMYNDVATFYRTIIRQNPGCWMAYNNLGNLCLGEGKVEDSIELFQQALRVKADNPEAQDSLGLALLQMGKVEEAIKHFAEALRIRPNYAEAHNNLGLALEQAGRREDAIAHYERAVQIRPVFAAAHINLGFVLLSAGRFQDAISHFDQALRVNPNLAEAQYGLGHALFQSGRIEDAIVHYTQATRLKPSLAEAHHGLGMLLASKGKTNEAIDEYLQALRFRPSYAEARNDLGAALTSERKLDEAITNFVTALQLDPNYADAHYNLGVVLARQGRVDEAISHLQTALTLEPESERFRRVLDRLRRSKVESQPR